MERYRRRSVGRIVLLCGLLLAAAGCEKAAPPTPINTANPDTGTGTGVPAVQPPKPAPAEPAIPSGQLRMHLNTDPRLQAPITTLVSPAKQNYVIRFGDPMNTASVEQALQKQRLLPDTPPSPSADTFDVKLQFRWEGDRTLHVTAEPVIAKPTAYPQYRYQIHAAGAQTANGNVLEKPPAFQAVIDEPSQLWRVSSDGSVREKISSFADPFWFQRLDGDPDYALAMRTTGYCECDAPSPKHYSVYRLSSKELVHYPVELLTTYHGPGQFTADSRGFFYEATSASVPAGGTTYNIKVDGYVHGASLSKDRKHVLMAVGATKETTKNLDFILYTLADGTMKRMPGALVGSVPENQVSDGLMPVPFADNGKEVRVMLTKTGGFDWSGNVYSWEKGTWQQLDRPETNRSDDGVYEVDIDDKLYKDGKPLPGVKAPSGFHSVWLKGSHRYAYLSYNYDEAAAKKIPLQGRLYLYDADQRKSQELMAGLGQADTLFGASSDGKWIYILSKQELPVKK